MVLKICVFLVGNLFGCLSARWFLDSLDLDSLCEPGSTPLSQELKDLVSVFNFFAPRGIQSHFMIYCWFESLDMRTYCPYYRLQLPSVKGSIAELRSSLSFKKGKKI